MSASIVIVRPPNSLVLIGDSAGEPPGSLGSSLVGATATCVAVGTAVEADEDTKIRVATVEDGADLPRHLAFEGELRTPSGWLTIASVLDDTYLARHVKRPVVRLQTWVNELTEPHELFVMLR